MGEIAEVLVALVEKSHPVVANIIVLAIGAVIVLWIFKAYTVLKNNLMGQKAIQELIDQQRAYTELSKEKDDLTQRINQASSQLSGLKITCAELENILLSFGRFDDMLSQKIDRFFNSISERLTSDLKSNPGEIHRCAIWGPFNSHQLVAVAASSAFSEIELYDKTLPIETSSAGRCFKTGKLRVSNPLTDENFYRTPNSNDDIKSLVCAPLVFGKVIWGVLTVDAKEEDAFTKEDIKLIETYTELATMAYTILIAGRREYSEEVACSDDKY